MARVLALGLAAAAWLATPGPAAAQAPTPEATMEAPKGAFGAFGQSSDEPIDINSQKLTIYDDKKQAVFTGKVNAVQGKTSLRSDQLDVFYKGSANPMGGGAAEQTEVAETPADDAPAGEAPGGLGTQITKIEAKGNVHITGEKNQSTTCKWATYDVAAKTVTAGGGVTIRDENKQTTKSDTAVYDMEKDTVTVRGNVTINSGKDQTATSDWAIYNVATELVTVGGNVVLTQGKNVLKGSKLVINMKTGESRFENPGDSAANNRIRALFMPQEDGKGKKAGAAGSKQKGAARASQSNGNEAETAPIQLVPDSQR
ncbi:LptA/OstA family protein [Methyloligella sp. 2.7D]|uniref:LptA/OstA family protein n=1 Tax=unclassified Methyloligella TaxID=2625955 RepID=UPI00157C74D7|nr:LptA/OstA family protein [Methyloligella sp. GL2]QKP76074.1 LPS export ABC transporter periplasmic protein LptC [Methyloligella sp. GL2]